jgi:Zn-dependent protease
MNIWDVIIIAPSALIALTLHELAHGLVAFFLGDPTAKRMGRLTLNPLKHLDLMGTILLIVLHFGWAKPVIVNPNNFKNPKRDMVLVAIAGPLTNLILAALFGLGVKYIVGSYVVGTEPSELTILAYKMFFFGVLINVSLAVFNMLPIPPLDGSRLIGAIVPDRYYGYYRKFEKMGTMFLMGILLIGAFSKISIIGGILNAPVGFLVKFFSGV